MQSVAVYVDLVVGLVSTDVSGVASVEIVVEASNLQHRSTSDTGLIRIAHESPKESS